MDKIFSVIGIAKSTLIIRGGCFPAKHRFETNLTEKELNSFKDYIEILECKEQNVGEPKQEPVAEKVETITESPKEEILTEEESTEKVEEEIKPKEKKENGLSRQSSKKGKGTNKNKV